jgi:hypothetical protein
MMRLLRGRLSTFLGWIAFGTGTAALIYLALFIDPTARAVLDTLLFAMTFVISAGLFIIAAQTYNHYIRGRERQERGGDEG